VALLTAGLETPPLRPFHPLALFVAVLWAAIFIDVRPAFPGCSSRACSHGPEDLTNEAARVELEGRHEYQTYATI